MNLFVKLTRTHGARLGVFTRARQDLLWCRGDRDGHLDGLGLGPGPQVVHARLEPLLPAVEMHRAQLRQARVLHEDVE